jgi:hypothetical protein
LLPVTASANPSATGTLLVTATVNSSINLVFNSDAAGVPLTGTGTNAATLPFGPVQAFGVAPGAGITRVVTATTFTVSSPFDVFVTRANSSSANYTLTAQLNAADAVNSWTVGGVAVTSASASTITATGAYNGNVAFVLGLTIPFTEAAGAISNTVNFTATAN